MCLTDADVAAALHTFPRGGQLDSRTFTGICTDSRALKPGNLFVALISSKANGHDYLSQAQAGGAAGVVVSQQADFPASLLVYRVEDTEAAYGKLARCWREKFSIPVIGVTGSVGKTTVKEMIAAALSSLGPILKTPASQNNETGVPKTLLQLTSAHRAAVVEMGMRGSGQIKYLCQIARPTIGVITLISDNHLELLGSRDAIASAKAELLEALPDSGIAVLNADDPYFDFLSKRTPARLAAYRMPESCHIQSTAEGWQVSTGGGSVSVPSPARHDIANALAALAVAQAVGVPLADAAEGLKHYTPPPMRMEIVKTNWGGILLNDAYNAAPASMKSALETLHSYPAGRRIAFLGDMKELGAGAAEAHEELGKVIQTLGGLDALYTVGCLSAHVPGATRRFSSSSEAAAYAASALPVKAGDVILVKGSRAMAMEQIAEALVERPLPT